LRRGEDAACVQVAVQIAAVVAARPRGRLSMSAASRLWRRGRAWLEHRGSVRVPRVLYRWWARMAPAGWQLAGSPGRFRAARWSLASGLWGSVGSAVLAPAR